MNEIYVIGGAGILAGWTFLNLLAVEWARGEEELRQKAQAEQEAAAAAAAMAAKAEPKTKAPKKLIQSIKAPSAVPANKPSR